MIRFNRNMAFVATYVIVLGLLSFAGYYFYEDYSLKIEKIHKAQDNSRFKTDLAYVDLPRMSLTMASLQGHTGNIRMDITLEVDAKYAAAIQRAIPRISDHIVHYSETLNYDDLAQPKALIWLKPDMLREVNSGSAPAPVRDIVFRALLVY